LTYQYKELNALHEELKSFNFTILAFPSNQFGKQEPGENNEILPLLRYIRPGDGFVPNFQLFQKGDVNGESEQEQFTYMKPFCQGLRSGLDNKAECNSATMRCLTVSTLLSDCLATNLP
ncbi:hypothetical protein scyTo_0020869, partial [Scyliorhinus torazame]|nr:hypothetical protein [Scyliorhinus torazame]